MFLRATKRFKDGKVHYYWSMVENVRVGRRVFRIARGEAEPPKTVARGVRQALYLGELNDSQREEWQRAIEAHIFTAFMALCLLQTLRAIAREHSPGLTPRQIIDKFRAVKMVDVVMPRSNGQDARWPYTPCARRCACLVLGRQNRPSGANL